MSKPPREPKPSNVRLTSRRRRHQGTGATIAREGMDRPEGFVDAFADALRDILRDERRPAA